MKPLTYLSEFIKLNDLFYTTQLIRYQKENQYKSLTGGILSFGIIAVVLVGFAKMILDTLTLSTFTYTMNIVKEEDPSTLSLTFNDPNVMFMFGIELGHINLNNGSRYFDIVMYGQSSYDASNPQLAFEVPLQTCTLGHWTAFPDIQNNFNNLKMNNWLCPQMNSSFFLSGIFTSKLKTFTFIEVRTCKNLTDPSRACASPEEIEQLFSQFDDSIAFTLYHTNPLLNLANKDYKSYYLESNHFLYFGREVGQSASILVAPYDIQTDYSILPYSDTVQDQGIIIEDKGNRLTLNASYGTYARISLLRSSNDYFYLRKVQKISSVVSFIGGMVSAISAFLFMFNNYSNIAYEVAIGMSIFRPPEDLKKHFDPTERYHMNLFGFCIFYLYNVCQSLGFPPNWPKWQFISKCRQEMIKQLDIKSLINRIIFIEHSLTHLFQDYQLEGLQLIKPKTPGQIRQLRQKFDSLEKDEVCKTEVAIKDQDLGSCNPIVTNLKMEIKGSQISPGYKISPSSDADVKRIKINLISLNHGKLEQQCNQPNCKPQIHKKLDEQAWKIEKMLIQLKYNAETGNPLSKKIWNYMYSNFNNKNKEIVENQQSKISKSKQTLHQNIIYIEDFNE